MTKTKEMNEKLLSNYRTPYQRAKEHSEFLKTQRQGEQDWKSSIKSHVDSEMPKATEERKQALVMKTMYDQKHMQQEFEDQHELTFKPDLRRTLAPSVKRVYNHTGKWEKSKFDD